MYFKSFQYKLWAAAFIGSCFFLIACENDSSVVDKLFQKQVAVEEGFTVESFFSQGGKLRAKLKAPYMKRFVADSPYVEFPKYLHVDFYDSSLAIESYLDAHYAKHVEYDRKILIRDSVVVINKKNGDTLITDELWWNQDTQEFTTQKQVTIYQKTGYTIGKDGMRAKQDLSEWWIFNSFGNRAMSDSGFVD